MKKRNGLSCKTLKKMLASVICMAEAVVLLGGVTACGAKDGGAQQPEAVLTAETQPEAPAPSEAQQESAPSGEVQPEAPSSEPQSDAAVSVEVQQGGVVQSEIQPETAASNGIQQAAAANGTQSGQIGIDEAKQAALADAGVSASDAVYTKEKLDYEDGIAVYDVEFYVGQTEYEYEINAATGEVYSKKVETHQAQPGRGQESQAGMAETYIGAESAETIALNHAGFSAADVRRLQSEFDIDDGLAVYEVEFDKDGREYEYTIGAADGSVLEYDVD